MKKPALFAAVLSSTISLNLNAADAEPLDQAQSLNADEAFVLVSMGTRGPLKHYVSSLTFSGQKAGIELSVPREKGMQLVKVKAGYFKPDEFGIGKSSHQSGNMNIARNEKGIYVEPGTVTYIGNWDIYYGQRMLVNGVPVTSKKEGYRISYSVDNLFEYAEQNEWITKYPLRVSHINGKRVANNWVKAES